jgi:hypothetical protein
MRESEMAEALSLTPNEAGYVVEQPSTAINRAVDKGIIKARLHRRGKTSFRQIGAAELRYLAIAGLVEKDLTPAARKKVYDAVRRLPATEHRLNLGVMELKLAEVDQRIAERLARLAGIKAHVDESAHEPRLKDVGVPVHVIAGLARDQTVEEIMEDYPGLRREQVVAAIEYAKIYPRTGRPLPQRSFKRMLSELADAGVWDVESDAEPVEPRTMP